MARRRELGSIASGIIGSFTSRNNDLDGYWGLGKLYLATAPFENKLVEIELMALCITPANDTFSPLVKHYAYRLKQMLLKCGIPAQWVVSAKIVVHFEVKPQQQHHNWRNALGKPCHLYCDLLDDNGRHHTAHAYTVCRPHDPRKELKSGRADEF